MTLTTAVLSLSFSFVVLAAGVMFGTGKLFQRVNSQEERVDEVLSTLARLEGKIDKQGEKIDTHIQYHLEKM